MPLSICEHCAAPLPCTCPCQVAVVLSEKDVIRAHARDELGIDVDELANPLQVRSCTGTWTPPELNTIKVSKYGEQTRHLWLR